jgi:hypothetical protein
MHLEAELPESLARRLEDFTLASAGVTASFDDAKSLKP